jgi:hypothetical protein
MWLITSFIAAVAVTAVWIFAPKKYQLGLLGLMLWGLSIMVLVDHIMGYEGGAFVGMETDGLIPNGVVLACFIVPMSLAIVVGAIRNKIPASFHINWLIMLLGGGVAALALEHIAHQEIVPYPPFLTAMSSPSATAVMLQEMATIGSAMVIACVVIWVAMVVYVSRIESNKSKTTV